MTFYRKHHPYDWMKGHVLKPKIVEAVFSFFILLITFILLWYIVRLVFFALKIMNIIETDFT